MLFCRCVVLIVDIHIQSASIVAHGCRTAQRDTHQAFKVKYMIKCILHISDQIAVKCIHSSTPTKVDSYLTLENRESIRTLKIVDLNVMTFVSIGTIRRLCTD